MAKNGSDFSKEFRDWSRDSRITVRREGFPDPSGKCVVYWMQRAQRGIDNHAVDIADREPAWLTVGCLLCGHLELPARESSALCLSESGLAGY
jgi:hypothetical protein